MSPMTDLTIPTCPTCGYRAANYARHIWQLAKQSGGVKRQRLTGIVVRCEECSTGTAAAVVPYVFRADELDAA